MRAACAAGVAVALALALLLFSKAVRLSSVRTGGPAALSKVEAAARAWPPDPTALNAYAQARGQVDETTLRLAEEAARIEPTGGRLFRVGRLHEAQQRFGDAVRAYERALRADPNSLQIRRALAEARQKAGDPQGALAEWKRLIALHEGLVGRVRAIPELTETHPAFGYEALAEAAREAGDRVEAAANDEKAAAVAEAYADTAPLYQGLEAAGASLGGDLLRRRRELRDLYERVMAKRLEAAAGDERAVRELSERRSAYLGKLDKMIAEAGSAASGR